MNKLKTFCKACIVPFYKLTNAQLYNLLIIAVILCALVALIRPEIFTALFGGC